MSAMKVYHTRVGCVQDMFQRSTGHVDVSLVEYGEKGFGVPMHVPFGRSQVWGSEGSEAAAMLASLAPIGAVLALGLCSAGTICLHGHGAPTPRSCRPSFGTSPGACREKGARVAQDRERGPRHEQAREDHPGEELASGGRWRPAPTYQSSWPRSSGALHTPR